MNWNIAKRAMRLKQIHDRDHDTSPDAPAGWRLTKKQAKKARKQFRKFKKKAMKQGYYGRIYE